MQERACEAAAVREAMEETGLQVTLETLFYVYSDPRRDPRKHTLSTVFTARASGEPIGMDDAEEARIFSLDALPDTMAFDHAEIPTGLHSIHRDRRPPLAGRPIGSYRRSASIAPERGSTVTGIRTPVRCSITRSVPTLRWPLQPTPPDHLRRAGPSGSRPNLQQPKHSEHLQSGRSMDTPR